MYIFYIFPFLSSLSLPETFQAIMKKTTSEVRWRKANITKADFLKKVVKKIFKWSIHFLERT